jgi:hypothetical protein
MHAFACTATPNSRTPIGFTRPAVEAGRAARLVDLSPLQGDRVTSSGESTRAQLS